MLLICVEFYIFFWRGGIKFGKTSTMSQQRRKKNIGSTKKFIPPPQSNYIIAWHGVKITTSKSFSVYVIKSHTTHDDAEKINRHSRYDTFPPNHYIRIFERHHLLCMQLRSSVESEIAIHFLLVCACCTQQLCAYFSFSLSSCVFLPANGNRNQFSGRMEMH